MLAELKKMCQLALAHLQYPSAQSELAQVGFRNRKVKMLAHFTKSSEASHFGLKIPA